MTTYCGVDFQTRQQTICYCETADGEIQLKESYDRRDAGLFLDLLPKQELPQMHQAKLLHPGLRIIFAILPSRL